MYIHVRPDPSCTHVHALEADSKSLQLLVSRFTLHLCVSLALFSGLRGGQEHLQRREEPPLEGLYIGTLAFSFILS